MASKNSSAVGELLRIESFLEMSFNGGTDIAPAFERACEVLDEVAFTNAENFYTNWINSQYY